MATETQNGAAVLHGIRNDGSAITMTGYATFLFDTAKLGHKFKVTEVEDEIGFDAALVATNAMFELDVTFVPKGADRDAAEAVAVTLEPLSLVTLAHFNVDAFNGDYIYMSDTSIDLSHSTGKMGLKLRRYADATQNTSLTNTI